MLGARRARGVVPPWTPASLSDLIHYGEARSGDNTITTGDVETLAALFGSAAAMGSASSTVRPALSTHEMINGDEVVSFDGVDEWLRALSVARPTTIAILVRQVVWESGLPIVSFGSGNFPRLRKSGVSNRVDFQATGATPISQPAATLNDEYFRVILTEDDGAEQFCTLYDGALDEATAVVDSDANADSRAADGQTLSLAAFVTGGSPAELEVVAVLAKSGDLLTSDEKTALLTYWRENLIETGAVSVMPFVGTRTANSNAQPRPYPASHEAVSGDTIASCAARLVGSWGGSGGTTIGSGDDPGAGNRGAMEALATTQGLANLVALVMVGTNDASSGAINATNYERFIRRLFAVAGVTPASNLKVFCAFITPRTDGAGVPQGRIDTFNDTDLPALIATLQGEGFAVDTWDPEADFNTGTMLQGDAIHPNLLGAKHVATAAHAALTAGIEGAGSLISASNRLVLVGDSITAGGSNLVPQATAQYRPWLARLLAS